MLSILQCMLEREQDTTFKVLQVCQDTRRAGNPAGACEFCLQACGSRRLGSKTEAESQKWAGVSQWERTLRIQNWENQRAKEHSLERATVNDLEWLEHELLEVGRGEGGNWQGKQEGSREAKQPGPGSQDICHSTALEHLERVLRRGLSPACLQGKSRNAGLGEYVHGERGTWNRDCR